MDKKIIRFLNRHLDVLFLVAAVLLALAARFVLYRFESHDYNAFLAHWFDTLKDEGFQAFRADFSDYPPGYLYLLWLTTFLPLPKLYLIKSVSVLFDFVLAFQVFRLVRLKYVSRSVRYAAFAATLFLPSVFLNGSVWGQCDVIYTAFLLGCLYQYMNRKPAIAMLYFAFAFSLKLQAIFMAPLLVFLLLKGIARFRHLLIVPAVYLLLALPAVLAGRGFADILLIYFRQYDSYHYLTMAFPNFYHWLHDADPRSFSTAGVLVAGAVVLMLLYAAWKRTDGKDIHAREFIVSVALVSTMVLPYVLPRMHERYYFPADVISLVWAFLNPKRAWAAVGVSLVSLFSYAPYLFGREPMSQEILAIGLLVLIGLVIRETARDMARLPELPASAMLKSASAPASSGTGS